MAQAVHNSDTRIAPTPYARLGRPTADMERGKVRQLVCFRFCQHSLLVGSWHWMHTTGRLRGKSDERSCKSDQSAVCAVGG